MTRFVVRIKVDKGTSYIHHKRDVVTTKTKKQVLDYFENLYSKHKESGSSVNITFDQELECGDLFEVL